MLAHVMSIRRNKDKTVRSSPDKPRIIKGNWRVWLHSLLTSELDTGEWSTSRPSRFIPRGKRSKYSVNRGQCGPQSYTGHLEKKKNFLPLTGFVRTVVYSRDFLLQIVIFLTLWYQRPPSPKLNSVNTNASCNLIRI